VSKFVLALWLSYQYLWLSYC